MTHDEMIQVIQAHKEGKVIEFTTECHKGWLESTNPTWNFQFLKYRIKVKPITRYIYIGTHPNSSTIFHSSGCYAEYNNETNTFFGRYDDKYTVNGTLKLSIDPHTNELLSVEIVK